MRHDYFSSLDQSNSLFVALSLPFPSSMLKLPIKGIVGPEIGPQSFGTFE